MEELKPAPLSQHRKQSESTHGCCLARALPLSALKCC